MIKAGFAGMKPPQSCVSFRQFVTMGHQKVTVRYLRSAPTFRLGPLFHVHVDVDNGILIKTPIEPFDLSLVFTEK